MDTTQDLAPHRPNRLERKPASRITLEDMLTSGVVLREDWEALPDQVQVELISCVRQDFLLGLLITHGLLTDYQASCLDSGTTFGLLLGRYRVLDRLGSGGMGAVYKAEHIRLRKQVAIKVLHASLHQNPQLLERFAREIRAVAQLHHPNVVAAIDVGEAPGPSTHQPTLHYFVMEYVPGQNLEDLVIGKGPLPLIRACDVAYQVADALAEAHKHGLVHRDIKPSNVQLTPDDKAKLLDFGLTRLVSERMTSPGVLLGSIEYLAPEQARDASSVDIRADIYGLGGILYWCLTGRPPFPARENMPDAVARRMVEQPPSVRNLRPDLPTGLDAVLTCMMAVRPDDRYATPQAVMEALRRYLKPDLSEHGSRQPSAATPFERQLPSAVAARVNVPRVLIVDDESDVRELCRSLLESESLLCDEAGDGASALEAVALGRYDLVLLDIDMPRMSGREVLRRLREAPPCPHLKVIMFSGRASTDDMAEMMLAGADDYLAKPFSVVQLDARIKAALRFKEAQDRMVLLNQQLLAMNRELESKIHDGNHHLLQVRDGLVLALSKLVEYRDSETGEHLIRMQRFSRRLAEEASRSAGYAGQIDDNYIDMLVSCVPLHDIGKAIVPDHILLKPGRLAVDERLIMQRHTIVGRSALAAMADPHGLSPAFLQMATDIVGHHHERYDGTGYPDGLAGTAIPLAARIVAVADVYDALRSRRVYKPSLSHAAAVEVITRGCEGQFDPALLSAFVRCASHFEQTFRELPD
jgi:response regulator RpfG family c-di-GMP phosphodiesterase/tRNA A-37 threonylcarbamoyl transferase component Bud32